MTIESIKTKLWDLLKEKQVSPAMFYDPAWNIAEKDYPRFVSALHKYHIHPGKPKAS